MTTILATLAAGLAVLTGLHLHSTNHAPIPYSPSLRCDSSSLLPTPSFGIRGAVFTLCAEETIQGSLSEIYSALLDFRRYDAWNSFVYHVAVESTIKSARDVQIGTVVPLHTTGLIPGLNTTSVAAISVLEPPSKSLNPGRAMNAWVVIVARGYLLRTEHPNLLTDLGDGTVRYVSYETMYGPVAWIVKALMAGALQRQFEAQGRDLKSWVEAGLAR